MTLTVSSTASRPWLFGEPDFCRLWLIGLVVFFSALARNAGGGGVRLSAHRLATHRRAADHAADAADGANRRLALMLLCSIVGTILAWSHALKVWHLALASFISGLTWTTDNPVRRTRTSPSIIRSSTPAAEDGAAVLRWRTRSATIAAVR